MFTPVVSHVDVLGRGWLFWVVRRQTVKQAVHQCAINMHWPDGTVLSPEDPKGISDADPVCGISWLIMWRIISFLALLRSDPSDLFRCSHDLSRQTQCHVPWLDGDWAKITACSMIRLFAVHNIVNERETWTTTANWNWNNTKRNGFRTALSRVRCLMMRLPD